MDETSWGDLERLADEAIKSAKSVSDATRAGVGSPIERRMADAFTDMSAALSSQAAALAALGEQQKEVGRKLDLVVAAASEVEQSALSVRGTVEDEARAAVGGAMADFGGAVADLKKRADSAIAALGKVDGEAAKSYSDAVRRSVGALSRATAGACAVIALMALAGGVWALIGASWFVRMSPEVQEWATTAPAFVVGIAVPVVAFVVGLVVGLRRR